MHIAGFLCLFLALFVWHTEANNCCNTVCCCSSCNNNCASPPPPTYTTCSCQTCSAQQQPEWHYRVSGYTTNNSYAVPASVQPSYPQQIQPAPIPRQPPNYIPAPIPRQPPNYIPAPIPIQPGYVQPTPAPIQYAQPTVTQSQYAQPIPTQSQYVQPTGYARPQSTYVPAPIIPTTQVPYVQPNGYPRPQSTYVPAPYVQPYNPQPIPYSIPTQAPYVKPIIQPYNNQPFPGIPNILQPPIPGIPPLPPKFNGQNYNPQVAQPNYNPNYQPTIYQHQNGAPQAVTQSPWSFQLSNYLGFQHSLTNIPSKPARQASYDDAYIPTIPAQPYAIHPNPVPPCPDCPAHGWGLALLIVLILLCLACLLCIAIGAFLTHKRQRDRTYNSRSGVVPGVHHHVVN